MLLSRIDVQEAAALGECYLRRSRLTVGSNSSKYKFRAQEYARTYLQVSVDMQRPTSGGVIANSGPASRARLVLANLYYLEIYQQDNSSLAGRFKALHLAIRLYLDYFGAIITKTKGKKGEELPRPLQSFLKAILPDGFENKFDLNHFCQTKGAIPEKQLTVRAQHGMRVALKGYGRKEKQSVDSLLETDTERRALLEGADQALQELIMCIIELKALASHTKMEAVGLRELSGYAGTGMRRRGASEGAQGWDDSSEWDSSD